MCEIATKFSDCTLTPTFVSVSEIDHSTDSASDRRMKFARAALARRAKSTGKRVKEKEDGTIFPPACQYASDDGEKEHLNIFF
jgi:hypothetical protein